MHLLVLINLCIYFLFYNRVVSSSRNLFSRNERILNDTFGDVLQKFFIDLNKVHLKKYNPWHVAILGASNEDFQQVQPLFKRYPHSVCKKIEICGYQQRFSQRSVSLVFLEDFNEEKFHRKVGIVLPCSGCMVLFISNVKIIEPNNLQLVLTWAMQHQLPFFHFVSLEKNHAKLYREFLAPNCTMQVEFVTVWKPGLIHLDGIREWAIRSSSMNGCPVSVSTLNFWPTMRIKENKNGSLTLVDGNEAKLLLLLAAKLNFTINLRSPSKEDLLNYSKELAVFRDVAYGISEIGIGRLRPSTKLTRTDTVAFTVPYDEECIALGVPRLLEWSENIVWSEFPWQVWAFVVLVFVTGCIIKYIYGNTIASKNSNEQGIGVSIFVSDLVNVLAVHLGYPVTYVASSLGSRFALMAYMCYAIVITTAYRASLASILATAEGVPVIGEPEGIIKADLKVRGSRYAGHILLNQLNESQTASKLLQRLVINNNDSALWNEFDSSRDLAILARRSFMYYTKEKILKGHGNVNFTVLDGCILAYPTVMYFKIQLFNRLPSVNTLIRRYIESGTRGYRDITENTNKILKRKAKEMYFEDRGAHQFWNIFMVYSVCIFISILTFLIELLI